MYFRFAAALVVVTAVALAAIGIQKQILSLKRSISLQHYNLQILEEKRARLTLKTQQLGAPLRLEKEQAKIVDPPNTTEETALSPQLEYRLRQR